MNLNSHLEHGLTDRFTENMMSLKYKIMGTTLYQAFWFRGSNIPN